MIFETKFETADDAKPARFCYAGKDDPAFTLLDDAPISRAEAVRRLRERAVLDAKFRGELVIGVDEPNGPIRRVGKVTVREPTVSEFIRAADGGVVVNVPRSRL